MHSNSLSNQSTPTAHGARNMAAEILLYAMPSTSEARAQRESKISHARTKDGLAKAG